MANPAVVTQIVNAAPNAAPLTLNELIGVLNPLISSNIQGSYIPYVLGHDTPGMEDTDKAWIELDSANRPLAIRTYFNGNWRRVYNGMIGEVRMYAGNPGDTTIWDTNGHGVVGGTYDGWQICNGKNNSPDLSDHFIVAAHMNNLQGHNGYVNNAWSTFVDQKTDQSNGGAKDHLILSSELPPFDATNGLSSVVIHGREYKSPPEDTHTPYPVVDPNTAGATDTGKLHDWQIGNYGANPNGTGGAQQVQLPIPTLPPFIALALIIFQGYTS